MAVRRSKKLEQARVSRESHLPLRLRLPNPPVPFFGRKREVQWLRRVLGRGQVAWILGPGGRGKTALVRYALHHHFAAQVPRTLFVGLALDTPLEAVRLEIARALAQAHGVAPADLTAALQDADTIGAALIDLAEAGSFWVVLDNVPFEAATGVRDLVDQLGRYARRSRWIVTSRGEPPAGEVACEVLALEEMSAADLARVGRALAPNLLPGELRGAVASSRGSPWHLKQLLSQHRMGGERDALASLRSEERSALEALALVSLPLPARTIAAAAGGRPEVLDALERQGLLERSEAGYRLHDLARGMLRRQARGEEDRWRARLAAALAQSNEPAEALEAARLLLAGRQIADTRALLERTWAPLVAAGFAPQLWRLLEPLKDVDLAGFRLRAAVELGDGRVLAKVREPPNPTPAEGLAWAQAMALRGELAGSIRAAAELSDRLRARGDQRLAFEAALLRARSLFNVSAMEEAIASLEGARPPDADTAARRDALSAACLGASGERGRALRQAHELRSRLEQLSPGARREATFGLARVFHDLGEPVAAADMIEAVLPPDEASVLLFDARRILLLYASIATDRGWIERARGALARIEPLVGRTSLLSAPLITVEAWWRLCAGELEGLETRLVDLNTRADPEPRWWAVYLRLRLQTLRAEASAPAEGDLVSPHARRQDFAQLALAEYRVRHQGGRPQLPVRLDDTEVSIQAGIVRGHVLLLEDRPPEALEEVQKAMVLAAQRGFGVREAEAGCALCEVLLTSHRWDDLRRAAQALLALAESMPSRRFSGEARFYAWASAQPLGSPAVLEELARLVDSAPVAARRAQSLLGGTPKLDLIDRRALASIVERPDWRPVQHLRRGRAAGAWQPGWGIDDHARSIWLPSGSQVDLSAHPVLWRLLRAIADRAGKATKEQLVREVWGFDAYNPLRHDQRVHDNVWKLRRVLEDDPARPLRLLTAENGYVLGGNVRRVQ